MDDLLSQRSLDNVSFNESLFLLQKVFYEDGDKETLDLKKERWELIEEDDTESESDEVDRY